jgi:hypothetical protein
MESLSFLVQVKASGLDIGEFLYSVRAIDNGSEVYEANGNYWDSGFTSDERPVYTNGSYSLRFDSYEWWWELISGAPSQDNDSFGKRLGYKWAYEDETPVGDYNGGSKVISYGTSMLPSFTSISHQSRTYNEGDSVNEQMNSWFSISKDRTYK